MLNVNDKKKYICSVCNIKTYAHKSSLSRHKTKCNGSGNDRRFKNHNKQVVIKENMEEKADKPIENKEMIGYQQEAWYISLMYYELEKKFLSLEERFNKLQNQLTKSKTVPVVPEPVPVVPEPVHVPKTKPKNKPKTKPKNVQTHVSVPKELPSILIQKDELLNGYCDFTTDMIITSKSNIKDLINDDYKNNIDLVNCCRRASNTFYASLIPAEELLENIFEVYKDKYVYVKTRTIDKPWSFYSIEDGSYVSDNRLVDLSIKISENLAIGYSTVFRTLYKNIVYDTGFNENIIYDNFYLQQLLLNIKLCINSQSLHTELSYIVQENNTLKCFPKHVRVRADDQLSQQAFLDFIAEKDNIQIYNACFSDFYKNKETVLEFVESLG